MIKLIIHKEYDVDEGYLGLLNILENMFISGCVSVPRNVYIKKLKNYTIC